MPKPVTRKQAVKALLEMFDRFVGSEKGSAMVWQEFCEDMKLVPPWDPDSGKDEDLPPAIEELLLAVGVTPQEIVNLRGYEPSVVFPVEMCEAYGMKKPRRRRERREDG